MLHDCVSEMAPPVLHEYHHEADSPTSKRSALAGDFDIPRGTADPA